ncbi:cupin domain-containing protein [Patulibacter americanus]|uniref:cupin domain-containing protein n=1 Tax=Patulibacter americanus TaxID=588672 RepID=UPI0003B56AFB|nr:cupin domain-containing protein [Patulibacter americanus]
MSAGDEPLFGDLGEGVETGEVDVRYVRGEDPAFAVDVATAVLEPLALDPEQVVEGTPETSALTLEEHLHAGGVLVEHGIWQITPGVATDVEVDEVFVVVSGRATVENEGGPTLELAPGTVGTLRAGDRTVWRVHETLRKVYVATTPTEERPLPPGVWSQTGNITAYYPVSQDPADDPPRPAD